jgi:hypothetical protein
MSDSKYIADTLLGSYADRKELEKAVESGARSVIKRTVNYLLRKRFPAFEGVAWIVDLIVDFVCDYFGW